MTTLTHLECALCNRRWETGMAQTVCSCGGPLLARYDLTLARESWNREWVANGPLTQWRYLPVLPARRPNAIVSLGEGLTPLVRFARAVDEGGPGEVWIKDEGANPAHTVAAREFSCLLSLCAEFGVSRVEATLAPGDATALAAYSARSGLQSRIRLPRGAPSAIYLSCRAYGAEVVTEAAESAGWFNASDFQEPYRIEGAKTLGYELAEQFRWSLPEVIVCPEDGDLLSVALWKAIAELGELGWIAPQRPRLYLVKKDEPAPAARLAVSASGGAVVTIEREVERETALEIAAAEGVLLSPAGAAAVAAARRLRSSGLVQPQERTVAINPASGLLFAEFYAVRFPRNEASEADKLGGLITPR